MEWRRDLLISGGPLAFAVRCSPPRLPFSSTHLLPLHFSHTPPPPPHSLLPPSSSQVFGTAEKLQAASFEQIKSIEGIGAKTAESLFDWFRVTENMLLLQALR